MPPKNGHTDDRREHPTSRMRAGPLTAPSPRPGPGTRELGRVPATVWAPPGYATGPGWTAWIRDTVRRSFLPPAGRWWDMTAALTDALPADLAPGHPASRPRPFWAALIEGPPPSDSAAHDHDPAGPAVADPAAMSPAALTATGPDASVDVVFADLTGSGGRVDGRVGMTAARALRSGGILAVLTRCRRHPEPDGALLDPTGGVVASAQNADLLYLQHIVVPTDPLRASRPTTVDAAHHARLVGHAIAHADLLVFAQPRALRPLTPPVAEPTAGDSTAPDTTGVTPSRVRP
jgi:hypothetical protein